MRKITEVLRLKWSAGIGHRAIAKSCGVAKSTVDEYVQRATAAGLGWPLPLELNDTALEQLLYPPTVIPEMPSRPQPDWSVVHQELSRRDMTLSLLWHEYLEQHPGGYQYSQFCRLYHAYAKTIDLSMRQPHRAGEKLFVDYAGRTQEVIDRQTGEVRQAEIFISVLGASHFIYAEATWTQGLSDWIGSHVRAFTFIGGVPQIVVPDNLKSGVSKTCRYEPELNPTYRDLAEHYGVAVIPARVRKPKDKAKVEVAVQIVERWILAALRKRQFFSLAELNAAIRELLEKLNNRPFKKLPGSRMSRFLELDKPALRPLPDAPYQFARWKKARVAPDYHIEFFDHYYSVPYQLVSRELDVRATDATVECFHKSNRVASHARSYRKGGYTTVPDHMPKSHREHAAWTPERMIRWAAKTGPATAELISTILERRRHPEQGFRTCRGILALSKRFDQGRIEAACKRALMIGGLSFKSVKSILETGLDQKPLPQPAQPLLPLHENIRGGDYYTSQP
jgi:transposase